MDVRDIAAMLDRHASSLPAADAGRDHQIRTGPEAQECEILTDAPVSAWYEPKFLGCRRVSSLTGLGLAKNLRICGSSIKSSRSRSTFRVPTDRCTVTSAACASPPSVGASRTPAPARQRSSLTTGSASRHHQHLHTGPGLTSRRSLASCSSVPACSPSQQEAQRRAFTL